MAGRALSLVGCSFGAGHLAFLASSDVSKGWCIIADKRIIGWWRIFNQLFASTDRRGRSAVSLLKVFLRIQRRDARWDIQQGDHHLFQCCKLVSGT